MNVVKNHYLTLNSCITGSNTWTSVELSLRLGRLYCHQPASPGAPVLTIPVQDVHSVSEEEVSEEAFVFCVKKPGREAAGGQDWAVDGKKWWFKASDQTELESWVQTIKKAKAASDSFLGHCEAGDVEGVDKCIKDGVDVNTEGDGSPEPGLMLACNNGQAEVVARLAQVPELEFNQDVWGYTAAHGAVSGGYVDCVKALAETGKVDWNAEGHGWCETPLEMALSNGDSAIVDIIVNQTDMDLEDVRNPLAWCAVMGAGWSGCQGGSADCVQILSAAERFDSWNDPHESDGMTPVMAALEAGKLGMVDVLVECPRVDVNLRDTEGWTLLMRSIERNNLGEYLDCLPSYFLPPTL